MRVAEEMRELQRAIDRETLGVGGNAPKFRTQEPEQPAEQARETPGFLPSGFRIGALHMFLQSSPDSLELESTPKTK